MRAADFLRLLLFAITLNTPSLLFQQPFFVLAQTDDEPDLIRGFAAAPEPGAAGALAPDLETLDAIDYILRDHMAAVLLGDPGIGAGDASIILRWTTMLHTVWYDAKAPYHPSAVGVYSDLGRRPGIEAETDADIFTALMFASHKVLSW